MRLFITILLIVIIYLMMCIFEGKETPQQFTTSFHTPHFLDDPKEPSHRVPSFCLWQHPFHVISIKNYTISDSIAISSFPFIQ